MSGKKVFILLPDGVGLRNFAFSRFYEIGNKLGYHITYWNHTPFNLQEFGFDEIRIRKSKHHFLTEVCKNARKHIELNLFVKKFNDKTYDSYKFPLSVKTFKERIKSVLTVFLIKSNSSESGLKRIRKLIMKSERKSELYRDSIETLNREKPKMVFCTNQRPMAAIAPLLAAQDLGIPTATFIFSWDNLPKATMVVETDYYFVWSPFMKDELLRYYPYIREEQIIITGTPQFENHFNQQLLHSRADFCNRYGLEIEKKYICFTGDDVTTSPDDPQYLSDVAQAVAELNEEGYNLGVVFRRCPVDFSNRYDAVLEQFKKVVIPVEPLWKKIGEGWNAILPTQEDLMLQTNTIFHTEFVVNLGSSMVFDYALHNKKCAYINYDVPNKSVRDLSVNKIYNYIHFRSMPDRDAVIWLNNPKEIKEMIKDVLLYPEVSKKTREWGVVILGEHLEKASQQIWKAIDEILN